MHKASITFISCLFYLIIPGLHHQLSWCWSPYNNLSLRREASTPQTAMCSWEWRQIKCPECISVNTVLVRFNKILLIKSPSQACITFWLLSQKSMLISMTGTPGPGCYTGFLLSRWRDSEPSLEWLFSVSAQRLLSHSVRRSRMCNNHLGFQPRPHLVLISLDLWVHLPVLVSAVDLK